MSLKSWFKEVGQVISRIFRMLTKASKKAVDVAIRVVDEIKSFDTAHPEAANLIAALIPGDVDDKIVAKIRAKLPEIMTKLRLADATLQLSDLEIILAGIKALQSLEGVYRKTALNSLAILITDVIADGKITWDELAMLPKWYYDNVADDDVDTDLDGDNDEN